MTSKTLFRMCGLLLLIEGGLFIILGILPSFLLPVKLKLLEILLDPDWALLSTLVFVHTVLLIPALIGLYLRQVQESGVFGFLGFGTAFLATCLHVGMQFDMAFVWPYLVSKAPSLLDFEGPLFRQPPFSIVHSLMIYSGLVGYLLFGIATIRARVIDRWRAILFTIGLPLGIGLLFPPFILRIVGGMAGGIGLLAVGWPLFNNTDQ
jgi:hypothetical protein